MSVIRALSACETNEQRDREKAKLEADYKVCDHILDELVSRHENDLSKVKLSYTISFRFKNRKIFIFIGYATFWFYFTNCDNK